MKVVTFLNREFARWFPPRIKSQKESYTVIKWAHVAKLGTGLYTVTYKKLQVNDRASLPATNGDGRDRLLPRGGRFWQHRRNHRSARPRPFYQ